MSKLIETELNRLKQNLDIAELNLSKIQQQLEGAKAQQAAILGAISVLESLQQREEQEEKKLAQGKPEASEPPMEAQN